MYGVGFQRRQLLHAEWNLSKLSAQARASTLKPDADLALAAMVDECDRVRDLLRGPPLTHKDMRPGLQRRETIRLMGIDAL
jgi:hypothetical protein